MIEAPSEARRARDRARQWRAASEQEKIVAQLRLNPAEIVTLTALIGLGMVLGRLVGGWLIDRFFLPVVGAVLMIGAAGGCLLLWLPGSGFGHALTAVLLLSLVAGLEYDLLAFLVARYIGLSSYGRVYGILFGLFAIGAGGRPALLGHAYDVLGNFSFGLRWGALGSPLPRPLCSPWGVIGSFAWKVISRPLNRA